MSLRRHVVEFEDYGPACLHTMPCAVEWENGSPAVFDMNGAVFQPCWAAQDHGYMLIRVRTPWLRRLIRKWFKPGSGLSAHEVGDEGAAK